MTPDVTTDWLALHGSDVGEAIAALRRVLSVASAHPLVTVAGVTADTRRSLRLPIALLVARVGDLAPDLVDALRGHTEHLPAPALDLLRRLARTTEPGSQAAREALSLGNLPCIGGGSAEAHAAIVDALPAAWAATAIEREGLDLDPAAAGRALLAWEAWRDVAPAACVSVGIGVSHLMCANQLRELLRQIVALPNGRPRALRLLWVRMRRSHPEIAALALQELEGLAGDARVGPRALHPTGPDGRIIVGEQGEAAARLHEIWRTS